MEGTFHAANNNNDNLKDPFCLQAQSVQRFVPMKDSEKTLLTSEGVGIVSDTNHLTSFFIAFVFNS